MKDIFADTFYFLAVLNPKDAAHDRALAHAASADVNMMYTTPWVLAEVAAALASPPHRNLFIGLMDRIRSKAGVVLVPATQELFDRGVEIYGRRLDKEWSLTDCISFVVMRDRTISEALTGDHHFEQAGFAVLFK